MIEFEPIEVTSEDGLVMVELKWIGEGIVEEFCEDDPTDEPLLRFSLYRKFTEDVDRDSFINLCETDAYEDGDWAQVRNGSYCTQLPATAPRETLIAAAGFILAMVEAGVRRLAFQKRLYEHISWIRLDEDKPAVPNMPI